MSDLKKAWDSFQYGPHPDVDGGPMNELCKAVEEHIKREELVLEVVQEFKHILCDYTRMTDLLNAVRRLAEWKGGAT